MTTTMRTPDHEQEIEHLDIPDPRPSRLSRVMVLVIVVVPFIATLAAAVGFFGTGAFDLTLTVVFMAVSGLGITAGYHRLFTHKSFVANRPLKIGLVIAGSLAFQGDLMSWVANHRQHHRHPDRDGDPHSPLRPDGGAWGKACGLFHSHVGWLLTSGQRHDDRVVADLYADRDLRILAPLFPLWATLGLIAPFFIGLAVGGTFGAALSAFVWAGLVRVFLMHHITWSINSVCHAFGTRPFRTGDASRNVRLLSVFTLGESWHNAHHAFPTLARHGVDRGQIDPTGRLIWLWEKLGWATEVRWARPELLATRRVDTA